MERYPKFGLLIPYLARGRWVGGSGGAVGKNQHRCPPKFLATPLDNMPSPSSARVASSSLSTSSIKRLSALKDDLDGSPRTARSPQRRTLSPPPRSPDLIAASLCTTSPPSRAISPQPRATSPPLRTPPLRRPSSAQRTRAGSSSGSSLGASSRPLHRPRRTTGGSSLRAPT